MQKSTEEKNFIAHPAIIGKLSDGNIVINQGKRDGVSIAKRILVYRLSSKEMINPFTKENLGFIEIPKASGEIVNVHDKYSIAKLDRSLSNNRDPELQPYADPSGGLHLTQHDMCQGTTIAPSFADCCILNDGSDVLKGRDTICEGMQEMSSGEFCSLVIGDRIKFI